MRKFSPIYLAITAVFLLFVLSPIYIGYGQKELTAISLAIFFFPLFFALQSAVSCVQLRDSFAGKGTFLRVCEKIRLFSCLAIAAIYAANSAGYAIAQALGSEIHPDFARFAIGTLWVTVCVPFALAVLEAAANAVIHTAKKRKNGKLN